MRYSILLNYFYVFFCVKYRYKIGYLIYIASFVYELIPAVDDEAKTKLSQKLRLFRILNTSNCRYNTMINTQYIVFNDAILLKCKSKQYIVSSYNTFRCSVFKV